MIIWQSAKLANWVFIALFLRIQLFELNLFSQYGSQSFIENFQIFMKRNDNRDGAYKMI